MKFILILFAILAVIACTQADEATSNSKDNDSNPIATLTIRNRALPVRLIPIPSDIAIFGSIGILVGATFTGQFAAATIMEIMLVLLCIVFARRPLN